MSRLNSFLRLGVLEYILDFIHPNVDDRSPTPEARQALAALARTCKATSEQSIARLWRVLDSLGPLMRCTRFGNLHEMTPEEWRVTKKYSCRIECIKYTIGDDPLTFLESILVCQRPESPLFPKLKSLVCYSGTPVSMAWIHSLLGPASKKNCPNLKSISVKVTENRLEQTFPSELSQSERNNDRLNVFTLSASLRVDDPAFQRLAVSSAQNLLFHYPEELTLITSDVEFATDLFRSHRPTFDTFRLYFHRHPSAKAMMALLSALASHPQTKRLREFSFRSTPPVHQPVTEESTEPTKEAAEYILSRQSIQPLLSFSNLRELVIEWGHQISFRDDDLRDMARSWPSLQVFTLKCGRPLRASGDTLISVRYITFEGLLDLVSSCPDLHSICLTVDARKVPTDVRPAIRNRNTVIQNLKFPESPINNDKQVARFLFEHFPSAREVSIPCDETQRSMSFNEWFWGEVDAKLESFHNSSASQNDADEDVNE